MSATQYCVLWQLIHTATISNENSYTIISTKDFCLIGPQSSAGILSYQLKIRRRGLKRVPRSDLD